MFYNYYAVRFVISQNKKKSFGCRAPYENFFFLSMTCPPRCATTTLETRNNHHSENYHNLAGLFYNCSCGLN